MLFVLKIARSLRLISKKKYNKKRAIWTIKFSPYFNAKYYIKQTGGNKKAKRNPAKHYYQYGWKMGLNPSRNFDTKYYLSTHSDVARSGVCPLLHYLNSGKNEGREIRTVNGAKFKNRTLWGKIKRALTKPVRIQEEYYQLKAEIKRLKNI